MDSVSCILIFDIGKTNKKYFVLDESYIIIEESSVQLAETVDEDGFPCEDIFVLLQWVEFSFRDVISRFDKKIKAVNFSTYGASLVHVDEKLRPVAPLYNYLKPFPSNLSEDFYAAQEGENNFSLDTSSPALGSLNAGLQLYWLKKQRPSLYEKIIYSLHLPQFISCLFSGKAYTELTSIGCHTALWNFSKHNYHSWVTETGIVNKLAPIISAEKCFSKNINGHLIYTGVGLHDSSAALLTYLHNFSEPFLLISTGTWSITLNPFNSQQLSAEELKQDCLCYLTTTGKSVKASRLFAGKWHEETMLKIASHFHLKPEYFSCIQYNSEILEWSLKNDAMNIVHSDTLQHEVNKLSSFDPALFPSAEIAYHHFMHQLVKLQAASSNLVLEKTDTKNIYVDGGFSKNDLYMQLLANMFPSKSIYAASVAQASAFGAALVIHSKWNNKPVPDNLVTLHQYEAKMINLP
jgi:sugar (pentulose or hexulose) kinase